jgi:hypothetical protein
MELTLHPNEIGTSQPQQSPIKEIGKNEQSKKE